MTPDEFAGMDLEKIRKQVDEAGKKKPEAKKSPGAPKKEPRMKKPRLPVGPGMPLLNPVQPAKKPSGFSINEMMNCWIVHGLGVSEQFDYQFAKRVLLNGELYGYHFWNEQTKHSSALAFSPASMPLHYDLFRALYQHKDGAYKNPIEDIRQFVSKELKNGWISTLTRIEYCAKPNIDKITHTMTVSRADDNYSEDIGGIDGVIDGKCTGTAVKACNALLGTTDTKQVYDVFKWLTDGREPKLQTYPTKQSSDFSSYLIMRAEKDKLRILAMARLDQPGKAFGFKRFP